jgi:SnoaL-like domain
MGLSDVEVLVAERAIRQVAVNYCRGIDRLDRELFESVWNPGATCEYEGMLKGTAEEITDIFLDSPESHRGWQMHSHQVTNQTVVLNDDGDRAVTETYVTARIRSFPDPVGRMVDMVFTGRYLDRLSKHDGIWGIDHRYLVNDVVSEYEVVTDFRGQLPDRSDTSQPRSSRDRNDPSYEHFASFGSTVAS